MDKNKLNCRQLKISISISIVFIIIVYYKRIFICEWHDDRHSDIMTVYLQLVTVNLTFYDLIGAPSPIPQKRHKFLTRTYYCRLIVFFHELKGLVEPFYVVLILKSF